jgi:hypothetical protein
LCQLNIYSLNNLIQELHGNVATQAAPQKQPLKNKWRGDGMINRKSEKKASNKAQKP